jgi:hypothetical protein
MSFNRERSKNDRRRWTKPTKRILPSVIISTRPYRKPVPEPLLNGWPCCKICNCVFIDIYRFLAPYFSLSVLSSLEIITFIIIIIIKMTLRMFGKTSVSSFFVGACFQVMHSYPIDYSQQKGGDRISLISSFRPSAEYEAPVVTR